MNNNTEVLEVLDKNLKPKDFIKAAYFNKFAEINGRKYNIMNFNHKTREKVFGYFTSVDVLIQSANFSFMLSDKFQEIKSIIFENTTFEKGKLSEEHFENEKYIFDYTKYIVIMMGAISYPFFAESPTD